VGFKFTKNAVEFRQIFVDQRGILPESKDVLPSE
jgi:hypothetical protein